MPYFTHRGYRFHYRTQSDGPLLLILPGNTASSALHAGELALGLWTAAQMPRSSA